MSIDRELRDEASELYADAPPRWTLLRYTASLAAALLLLGCILALCIALRP